jgi:hypothetical protein
MRNPLHAFLLLLLSGAFTASAFAMQRFSGLFSLANKVSSKTNPSQREHLDETTV